MKKKLFIFVSLLCLPIILLFPACKDDSGGVGSTPIVEQVTPAKPAITLDISQTSIAPGGQCYIVPSGATDPTLQLVFSSSDDSIATVDQNGLVTAKKLGTATITVTYGESTATCAVNVISNNYVPTVHFDYFAGDEISVSLIDSVNLSSYVMFNGIRYDDATFTYEFSDESIGKIEEGVFKPSKVGQTTLTIKGAWAGFDGVSLEKNIKITVINAFEFYVNNGETIYSIHNRENVGTDVYGKTEIDFNVHCLRNGVEIDDYVVTVVEGADVIRYDATDSKLKVVDENFGKAKVIVTATDSDGNIYELSFKIIVYESGPVDENENGGYFNPDWIILPEDSGNFNPDWVEQ